MKKTKTFYDKIRMSLEVFIRAVFFVLYPALFSTAFTGVKMLVGQVAGIKALEWNTFVMTLVILIIFTICFGRFFCGFLCAFGSYGDCIYALSSALRKKYRKKPLHILKKWGKMLRYGKYVVLLFVLLACIKGIENTVSLHSPVTVFSRLHALKTPDSMLGLFLFLVITAGMAAEPRFFCRFLCPMGAIFSFLPVLPFSVVKRDRENCIMGCQACKMACPAGLDIPSLTEGDNSLSGECFSCGKCAGRCPRQNIILPGKSRGWLPLTVIKAVIALVIFLMVY